MGHARALIGADEAETIAEAAVAQRMSVRDVEKLVRRRSQQGEAAPRRRARTARDSSDDADIAAVEGHLEEVLGLPVRIQADADARSGAVTIRYVTLDQLDLICQRLTGGAI
jgi:ParB family chromosome partitioning protein